jgi:hypothetical protein
MTHSLSQAEMAEWRQFKHNRAANYDYECECFLDFSIQRLGHWSDQADDMRSMTMESGSAPAAKPAGGHQDGPKKGAVVAEMTAKLGTISPNLSLII